eukprot:365750-Chlamydomonas_euryale.AAC.6
MELPRHAAWHVALVARLRRGIAVPGVRLQHHRRCSARAEDVPACRWCLWCGSMLEPYQGDRLLVLRVVVGGWLNKLPYTGTAGQAVHSTCSRRCCARAADLPAWMQCFCLSLEPDQDDHLLAWHVAVAGQLGTAIAGQAAR